MDTTDKSPRPPNPLWEIYVRDCALRVSRGIARRMGCWQVSIMDDDTLFNLIDGNMSDIEPGDLKRLETADIIIVAEHQETGETQYIAVESCVTAKQPYVHRAVRIAGCLSRFTSQPAHPVVASWFVDPDVEPIIASGRVHWYEIPLRHLESD